MFKAILLGAFYNLSDDQIEYQMRDRLSFVRFLGLALEDKVPDAKTVWLYREQLSQAGLIDALFEDFDAYLKNQGYQAMGGQIIDASLVAVPVQRGGRDDHEQIKRGETPKTWADKPAKRRQKDTDARWTKKHGKSHYGYKNHVTIDRTYKLIRRYRVTDAAVYDSQVVEELLTPDNTASGVWADSAYRSKAIEATVKAKGLTSRIHRKGYRNHPLRDWEKAGNQSRHGFGHGWNTSSARSETTWAGRWFAASGLCGRGRGFQVSRTSPTTCVAWFNCNVWRWWIHGKSCSRVSGCPPYKRHGPCRDAKSPRKAPFILRRHDATGPLTPALSTSKLFFEVPLCQRYAAIFVYLPVHEPVQGEIECANCSPL